MIQQTYASRHYRIMEVTQIGAASYEEEYPTKAALTAAAALLAQYPAIVRVNIYFHWELNHYAGSRLAETMTRRSTTYRQHKPTNQPLIGANNE